MNSRINIKGIIRNSSELNAVDGSCEEIINMRERGGVWIAVGEKHTEIGSSDYLKLFVHEWQGDRNFIGTKRNNGNNYVTEWFVIENGKIVIKKELISCKTIPKIKSLNNCLLVEVANIIYKFIWSKGNYSLSIHSLPPLPEIIIKKDKAIVTDSERISMNFGVPTYTEKSDYTQNYQSENDDGKIGDYIKNNKQKAAREIRDFRSERMNLEIKEEDTEHLRNIVGGKYKLLINSKRGYTAGYVFVCIAYVLWDGNVTKPSVPILIKLGDNYDKDLFYIDYINDDKKNGNFLLRGFINTLNTLSDKQSCNRITVERFNILFNSLPDYEKYEGIINGISVFCSPIIDIYDWEKCDARYFHFMKNDGNNPVLRYNLVRDISDTEGLPMNILNTKILDNIVFYKATTYLIKDLDNIYQPYLDLSDIHTKEVLTIDNSGWTDIGGDMLIYNNRLHLFNYTKSFVPDLNSSVSYFWNIGFNEKNIVGISKTAEAYVYLRTDIEDIVIKISNIKVCVKDNVLYLPSYLAFPDSRVFSVIFYVEDGVHLKTGVLNMTSSKVANVSYWSGTNADNQQYGSIKLWIVPNSHIKPVEKLSITDNKSIIVSAPDNPFYFPISQSYGINNSIIALAVNFEEITSSQVGQFPLYVFSDNGIFALSIGSGDVLYGNLTPLSPEICLSVNILQTKYGVVFVAQSGLKVINGRDMVDLSDAAEGNPDTDIRIAGYCEALNNDKLVNLRDNLSVVNILNYLRERYKLVMGFDFAENEIILSNCNYNYSYVYNFNMRSWNKRNDVFVWFDRHFCLRNDGGIIDLRKEDFHGSVSVLVQSRPVMFGTYGFKRFMRCGMRGKLCVADGRYFGFYIFGSNNLRDWELAGGKQLGGYFSNIMIERIKKWYRYFVFVASGEVERDCYISHFEAEGETKIDNRGR